ncbi:hypothetical protein CONLIGDRAFT_375209 [Coniochaeta ligniaria NRRL 30616]|uniref:Uncharacterized protein n=1 Tax=Coniochaeta ligniaria NRRL 30616 TaxID=1408157 RepID=A0A1J7JL42_9PEZI|nr:hypothetical protein CONLIGDRAFT_375209 [Coniochaeta ligniaria NRRL 30616]
MCIGYTYDLVCGHQLIHFATRCPESCPIPSGPRKPLNDTCAPCTPSFQSTNIARKYDELRAKHMRAIRVAQADGDREAEAEITKLMAKDQAERTAEMAKVWDLRRKLRVAEGGQTVVWPGKNDEKETNGPEDLFRVWKECVNGRKRHSSYDSC